MIKTCFGRERLSACLLYWFNKSSQHNFTEKYQKTNLNDSKSLILIEEEMGRFELLKFLFSFLGEVSSIDCTNYSWKCQPNVKYLLFCSLAHNWDLNNFDFHHEQALWCVSIKAALLYLLLQNCWFECSNLVCLSFSLQQFLPRKTLHSACANVWH